MKRVNKLNKQDKESIFDLYLKGYTITGLCKQFNVSRPTIYKVINVGKEEEQNDFCVDIKEESKGKIMTNTNFLGLTIDAENGPKDRRICKVLNQGFKLLDIMEFIKATKFDLNMIMFDYFWQVVVGNQWVHLHPLVLEWFGYEGEIKEQRKNFIKMLKRNNIPYQELTRTNKEIELYPTIKDELSLLPHDAARACIKFLIMCPKDLKMAIMQLKTKNGNAIREYYINLEELLKLYVEYTLYFNHRESQRKITDLEQMMADLKLSNKRQEQYMRSLGISLEEVKDQNDSLLGETKDLKKQNNTIQRKLGIAVEDRAPLPEDKKKRERFLLLKLNDPEYLPYYTIRAQYAYTLTKLKNYRTWYPNLEVLLDFKCNPNSKTLYVRIKESLKAKGVVFDGNNIDLKDAIEEEELLEEMKVINEQKYDV
ncbi:hypothetical protein DH26_gp132 [Chloriridovirus anopheles1]|uniref:Resolvase HTH domain-containing protein n=1 Tax=Chloriridovirus anopheles1 TaxID=1465751 RepID=W8QE87_9VIRU|nr:hypothetical protein DH26_gp132 [Anopheles minimus iridovirus]AHL67620.1 hypothetical protein AMIV_132 [Anopheles minimus iridovirus]